MIAIAHLIVGWRLLITKKSRGFCARDKLLYLKSILSLELFA